MLEQWAAKYGIPSEALEELRASFGCIPTVVPHVTGSEAAVQAQVRLEAAKKGNNDEYVRLNSEALAQAKK